MIERRVHSGCAVGGGAGAWDELASSALMSPKDRGSEIENC